MTESVRAEIPAYVLGLLEGEELARVEKALSGSAALRAEVRAVREALALLPSAEPAAALHGSARDALLAALDGGARFRPFFADLERHFDLGHARVVELCDRIDDTASWEAGPLPGIRVMHFAAGANAVAHDTGFVVLPAGLQFPYHRHQGHEVNYVLEGALRDGDGTLYLPGEAIVKPPGSAHEFAVTADADALIAVVQAGFDFIPKPE